MAIVEMSKLRLLGLTYHREELLNILHKTGCVELKETSEVDNTVVSQKDEQTDVLSRKYDRTKACVDFIMENIERAKGKNYYPTKYAESFDNFFVSYDEFLNIKNKEDKILSVIAEVEDCQDKLLDNKAEKIKLSNQRLLIEPYAMLKEKFSLYKGTEKTKVYLGTIRQENIAPLKEFLINYPLTELNIEAGLGQAVISVVSYVEEAPLVLQRMGELGFVACSFDYDMTAMQKLEEIDVAIKACDDFETKINAEICSKAEFLRDLKIYSDYCGFCLEKLSDAEKFRCTGSTFILEGYLPKEKQEFVKNAILGFTKAVFIEFSKPSKEDNPPTLLKNNAVIRQTEFITDLYSVPNYREFDPSKVVFFFFMIFMGVIMADIGYGILMVLLGIFLAKRIKIDSGARRLWYIIAIGGIFTVLFGLLFNSFFGFSVRFMPTILPSPVPDDSGSTENMMVILLGCLGLGVIQMATGYFCKAVNSFRDKDIAGGIFDGLIWVLFFVGFIFAAFNFLVSYLMPELIMPDWLYNFFNTMQMPGIIMTVGSVLVAAVTAGRAEKGFGKFSKGFGAVYGLINIMSDILSYARLFGLMLSGMIVAQTFNDLGLSLMSGGLIGYAFGPLVMVLGHTFNIAMGVLGAYIHDSRLQYIEFFSKFYTGEGEKFTPLGSKFEYIYLTK